DQIAAPGEFPLAPRRNYFDVRLQGVVGEFKSHLIVSLAGRAMCNSVRAFTTRNFNLAFGNYRTGEGSAEQVNPFVKCVSLNGRPDIFFDELFAQIVDLGFATARGQGLLVESS